MRSARERGRPQGARAIEPTGALQVRRADGGQRTFADIEEAIQWVTKRELERCGFWMNCDVEILTAADGRVEQLSGRGQQNIRTARQPPPRTGEASERGEGDGERGLGGGIKRGTARGKMEGTQQARDRETARKTPRGGDEGVLGMLYNREKPGRLKEKRERKRESVCEGGEVGAGEREDALTPKSSGLRRGLRRRRSS